VHIAERVRGMGAMVADGSFGPIRIAFRRAAGLVKGIPSSPVDASRFEGPAERELAAALSALPPATDVAGSLGALTALRPVVDQFFDTVLVMCDDRAIQANRLALLASVTDRFANLADFTRLSSE
jgi:glycyl-tRNA synthetase beta chain